MTTKTDNTNTEQTGATSDNFDLDAIYMEKISPLTDQLHALCDELGIPLFLVACVGQNNDGFSMRTTASFKKGRTPPEMMLSAEACTNGMDRALRIANTMNAMAAMKEGGVSAAIQTLLGNLPGVVAVPVEVGSFDNLDTGNVADRLAEAIEATRADCEDPNCKIHGKHKMH